MARAVEDKDEGEEVDVVVESFTDKDDDVNEVEDAAAAADDDDDNETGILHSRRIEWLDARGKEDEAIDSVTEEETGEC